MLPREFYIENRLEKYRKSVTCNLGESGFKNFSLGEIISMCGISHDELNSLSLEDSPNSGNLSLKYEISKLYQNVNPEQILITTGTSEALYLFFRTIIKKEMKVGYFSPAFQALYEIPKICGAKIIPVDILNGKNFEKLFLDSDLIILNHPHNPTGTTFSEDEWNILSELNHKHHRIILFDEHYRFLRSTEKLGVSGIDRVRGDIFATGSITKSFGVTGLRIGWIIGRPDSIETMRSYKDYLTHTVNPLSEYLCLKLLQNRSTILNLINVTIQKNISYFKTILPEISSLSGNAIPEGGLVSFPRLLYPGGSEEYSDFLLKECDVFVLPGANFEREGYIRIGFGENTDRFKEGINRWVDLEKNKKIK